MQGSSYAPLQFLRSPWNRDVYTAIDNQIDGRTVLVLYLGAASTLPSELQKYNVGCILIHKDEKQIYLNTGNDVTPTWESFGPGTNTLPTPFIAGQYLTNDGVDAFWSLIDLATGVDGLLDSDHIDLSDLANNSDFIDYLIGNSYFTSSLANDSNFLTSLITNLNTGGLLTVVTDGVTITGDGTALDPLVAVGSTPTPVLDIQENGITVEDPVDTINFVTPGGVVSSPATGVVDIDLSTLVNSVSSSGPYPGSIIVGRYNGNTSTQPQQTIGGYYEFSGDIYKTGAFGTALVGTNVTYGSMIPSTNLGVCYDYSLGKFFNLLITSLGGGNFTVTISKYDITAPQTVEATWTCSGFAGTSLPTAIQLNMVVDFQSLKAFFRTTTLTGSVSIDTTTIASNTTYVFDLSSSSGGTIDGTATSFTGGANFPVFSTLYSGSGELPLINSTTKKFITTTDNNKYTYSDTLGITATSTISFGDYAGRNTVMPDGNLYKVKQVNVIGGPSGIFTFYTDFFEVYYIPMSNTILNT